MNRILFAKAFGIATMLGALLCDVSAFASSPSLTLIMPRGVQRGHEHTLTFSGVRLSDAEEIFFYGDGITAKGIEVVDDKRVKVNIVVADDCRLGEHVAQVRTRSGISDFRTFVVGALPEVVEKEPNSLFDEPQVIETNVTVAGVVTSEDVDYFAIEAKKGERISVEVEAMRLGTTMFDPYVSIMNSDRFELAAADDTPLVKQDAIASVIAPEDGTYVIGVRETSYGGSGSSRYRLHIGNFPRPTISYPAGGKLGDEITVHFLGDPSGDFQQTFQLPSVAPERFGLLPRDEHGIAPSHTHFRLFPHGNAFEVEPNDARTAATQAELPLAFNGVIGTEGDVDFFEFEAKKNQVYEVECYARRIRSNLDPIMHIFDASGKSLVSNDDSRGPDSYVQFKVPADGKYTVRIMDHLRRGQKDFVYRIEFTPTEAKLALGIPQVARYSQYRQAIFVPRGNRFASLISAQRQNFRGEVVLDTDNLPEGVKVHSKPMAANLSTMPVVFEAASDAPIGGKLVQLRGRLNDETKDISGFYENHAEMVRGQPNNSIFYHCDVTKIPVVIVDELPFELELVEPRVPLVQSGSVNLMVKVRRKEGFKGAIRLEFPFRPPGVSTKSAVTLPADKDEFPYPLTANSKAQTGEWPVYVIGSSDVKGSAWVSSQLATLDVAQPYVTAKLNRVACEQGDEVKIHCTLNQVGEFEGEATAKLLGLPAKVTAPDLKFTKETTELVFDVKTDPASPAGKHKSVFVSVEVDRDGDLSIARAGTTELQIDKPLPKATTQPVAPKADVAKTRVEAKTEKPLTRLEKLRLAAKELKQQQMAAGSE